MRKVKEIKLKVSMEKLSTWKNLQKIKRESKERKWSNKRSTY